jgi:hypothetical protein
LETWPNAGMHGDPTVSSIAALDVTHLHFPASASGAAEKSAFSARVLGELTPPYDGARWWLISPPAPILVCRRGFIWGPQLQLVYWGLDHPRYSNVPSVTRARKALAMQSEEMFLSVWRRSHYVCENYAPMRNAGGGNATGSKCTGDFMYHWGGLAGFVRLLEEGLY